MSEDEFNPETWKELTLAYQGKRVRGNYKVIGRQVIVVSGSDSKTANLGILPADRLAHMLLRELAFEKQNKSPLSAMAKALSDRCLATKAISKHRGLRANIRTTSTSSLHGGLGRRQA